MQVEILYMMSLSYVLLSQYFNKIISLIYGSYFFFLFKSLNIFIGIYFILIYIKRWLINK